MAYELLGNLGESTLSAAITTTGATTLSVTSATPFPAAVTGTSQFRVIVDTEIMIVTNVSGTTFTVTRGAEGTTAATHASSAPITHVITAGALSAMFGGGTAGQVLAKTASADYAQAWTDPKWAGGDFYASGWYYHGFAGSAAMATTSTAYGLNTVAYRPFLVTARRAFDRIGIYVNTAGSAGAVIRQGIYSNNQGVPGSLIVDAGTVTATASGAKEAVISQTLDPGLYWLAMVMQGAVSTIFTYATAQFNPFTRADTSPITSGQSGRALTYSGGTSGALQSTAPTMDIGNAQIPAQSLRAA